MDTSGPAHAAAHHAVAVAAYFADRDLALAIVDVLDVAPERDRRVDLLVLAECLGRAIAHLANAAREVDAPDDAGVVAMLAATTAALDLVAEGLRPEGERA